MPSESTQTIGFSPQTKVLVLKNSVREEKTSHSPDLQIFCVVAWELFNHEDYYLPQHGWIVIFRHVLL